MLVFPLGSGNTFGWPRWGDNSKPQLHGGHGSTVVRVGGPADSLFFTFQLLSSLWQGGLSARSCLGIAGTWQRQNPASAGQSFPERERQPETRQRRLISRRYHVSASQKLGEGEGEKYLAFGYSWPHTHPIRGATLNLFQKTWGLGSGYWVRLRVSEVGVG